jgi:dTDP-4-dehydrorhamnose 3,5-epimerase-like enzyme
MSKKPDLYKRAKGYGRLADLHRNEKRNEDWRPVSGFPEYEVNANRRVRRRGTHAATRPYTYPMRPYEGEFVDFWVDLRKYVVSLDSIMAAAFPKEKEA